MAESVKIVAQISMDMFYQDYKPATAFLRLEHFIWLCVAADGKLKQDEYDRQVYLNMRLRRYNAQIVLNSDNYETVKVDIKNDQAVLPTPIMSFPGASLNLSISQVIPEGNCGGLMPITEDEKWEACKIKNVAFWFPISCGIGFMNLKENCNPTSVRVSYIPQLTSKGTVQESRKFAILNMVSIYVKSAKEGVVIDMSNDGNSNTSLGTEINKYLKNDNQR